MATICVHWLTGILAKRTRLTTTPTAPARWGIRKPARSGRSCGRRADAFFPRCSSRVHVLWRKISSRATMRGARLVAAFAAVVTCPIALFAQAPAPQPSPQTAPMSLPNALSTAMQQVSALQQAEIDQQLAAEDVRQAEAALLPRARDSFTVIYNSRAPGSSEQSFIAQNAVHEYQNLLGVTGDWNFGLFSAVRRSRALLEAARAGTEIARRAFVRGVNEAYYSAALATSKRLAAEQSLAAAEEFERVTDLNFRAGEVPEIDVIRARLQAAARRDDLAQARQAEAITYASLGTLLGYGITRAPVIETLPQQVDVNELENLTTAGVARRPEF